MPPVRLRKRLFAAGFLALVVMAWAACEEPAPTPVPGERIDWTRCHKLECGSIQVRVDSGRGQDRTLRGEAAIECAIDGWS